MCGITGIINYNSEQPASKDILEKMCDIIYHRGPDEGGVWVNQNVGIGMRRLRIIDLASGSQPMHNEDKTVWIVFNGEIYNYQGLRTELEQKGHVFQTNSDTETIVHLYEEYGKECVQYLRGMFAFAIYDLKNQSLMIARDRLGIKPMFYMEANNSLLFGSEIKCLFQHPEMKKSVHLPSIVTYFAYGYVPEPDSMFENVKKLPPGYLLTCKNGKIEIEQYWDVVFDHSQKHSEKYYIERILHELNEAVKIRLISDVPLGAFLSGGIDSSMVVALMAKNMAEPVKTFSIGFENQSFNELQYARQVSKMYGTDHHEEIVTPDAQAVIKDLIHQFDEPFADSSAIPMYYVSKMTRNHVTVALSGDGGDELFAGYGRYFNSQLSQIADRFPLSLRKILLSKLPNLMPEWFPGINTIRHVSCSELERYLRHISKGVSTNYKSIFNSKLRNELESTDPSLKMDEYLSSVSNLETLTRKQYLDIKTYLPGDILTKVDRMSMLVSLEARVPFIDHKFLEFAATIPPDVLIKNNDSKYLLKKTAEKLIPKEVIYRPKMGFSVPIGQWLRKEWKELSHDLIMPENSFVKKYIKKDYIDHIFIEHKLRRRDHNYLIWTLMVLEMWYQKNF